MNLGLTNLESFSSLFSFPISSTYLGNFSSVYLSLSEIPEDYRIPDQFPYKFLVLHGLLFSL